MATEYLTTATGRAGLNTLSLADLNGGLVVDRCGTHTFLDLSCHGQESLFNIGCVLRRRLEERYAKAIGEFLVLSVCSNVFSRE